MISTVMGQILAVSGLAGWLVCRWIFLLGWVGICQL